MLVFTNVRSAAEQIGLRLKELLPELADQIETHHASLDRSVRLEVEDRLKNGELRAVVCSTSLELGIDIGAVDLVVMVATPKGVSRAIQRIGRSGHSLNKTSHGVLVATNVNDLVEATVTARLVRQAALDPIQVLEKPNDVLAQHIVGMAALAPIAADEAFAIVRRAYPFRALERAEFDHVLDYLAGGGVRWSGNTPALWEDSGRRRHDLARASADRAGVSGQHRNDRLRKVTSMCSRAAPARFGRGRISSSS